MSLDSIIDVQIVAESSRITAAGFGRALILTSKNQFGAAAKLYTDPAGMLADGFVAGDQEYIDAVGLMSQNPSPQDFYVGKRAAAVALVRNVAVTGTTDGTYTITVNGVSYSYVATGNTAAQIATGLAAAVNAPGVTDAVASSTHVTLTATTAGIPFTSSVTGPAISISTTTPSHGLVDDIATIRAYVDDWYAVLIPQRDDEHNRLMASIVQPLHKIFFGQTSSSGVTSAPYNSGSPTADIGSELFSSTYSRTALWYHTDNTEPLAASMLGRGLASIPGSLNWAYKPLSGIVPLSLTTDQIANLLSKQVNSYRQEAGRGMTFFGTMSSGDYIDIIHGTDKLYARIQENVFLTLSRAAKIPFTDAGIQALVGQVRAALVEAVTDGFIAESRQLDDGSYQAPAFTVSGPKASQIPEQDRAARRIPATHPIRFEATLAGAVNGVSVRGTLTV